MKRLYVFLTVFLLLTATLLSQTPQKVLSPQDLTGMLKAPSNAGTDFYFSFPPCYEEESTGNQNSIRVFVASSVRQAITVEVIGKQFEMIKEVLPNDVVEFVIPADVAQPFTKRGSVKAPPEKVYVGSAVHVYSQSPVIVYGVTRYNYTSDGFLALPVSALGTEYIVAAWPQYTAVGAYQLVAETTISAAYDSTDVMFTMGGNSASTTSGGLKPGQTDTFRLNRGDVLCFASDGDIQDISGSTIRSNYPVGVVSGNQCANVPGGVPWCDYISEMELPTYTWGKEYHVTPFFGRKKMPYIRIFAKEKNTTVYRDGQQWLVIPKNSGKQDDGYIERRADDGIPRAMVISANKPIYVVVYNTGQADDNVTSDPFQMVLTPLEQYQKEIVFCTPGSKSSNNNFKSHYVNLIYRLSDNNTIPSDLEFATVVDGVFEWKLLSSVFGTLPGMLFAVPVNGNTYACKQLTLPGDGIYRIRATSPIAGYGYGFSNYDSYGFPIGAAVDAIGIPDSGKPIVSNWVQDCDGSIKNATVQDFPNEANNRSNLGLISLTSDINNTNYKFSYGTNTPYIAGQSVFTDWSLHVIDKSKNARAVVRFADRRGNDTTIVVEYKVSLPAVELGSGLGFGILRPGQTATKTVTLRNTGATPLNITRLELKNKNQGFALDPVVPLPFVLAPGASKNMIVTFSGSVSAMYWDSIGIGDDCLFTYVNAVTGEIATPTLMADKYNFQTHPLHSRTKSNNILLKNTGKVDITLTGDDHVSALANKPFKATDWNIVYPYTLVAGASLTFHVDFVPTSKGIYEAIITFSSDALGTDSTIELLGTAIDTTTVGVEEDIRKISSSAGEFDLNISPNPIGVSGGMVEITMPTNGFAELTLISSSGERVATLAQSVFNSGNYQVRIPIESLSSGSYIVRMTSGNFSLEKAVVIVK
ncbi:MAG: choice-of-anchor D domain-containing protein [Ignavibacteria bacterium]|nr:choice-of-anchor D domain-containing protein [Ignavibacteria bacterium]